MPAEMFETKRMSHYSTLFCKEYDQVFQRTPSLLATIALMVSIADRTISSFTVDVDIGGTILAKRFHIAWMAN